jgi:hypothetical protein
VLTSWVLGGPNLLWRTLPLLGRVLMEELSEDPSSLATRSVGEGVAGVMPECEGEFDRADRW